MPREELKISIIVPSYNQGQFLEQTILSINNQSYRNFEILLIDGGSNDSSLDVIKRHQDKLHYWVSEKDKGQSDAINKGLKLATGHIITWLNSDDYYEPGTLQKVADLFMGDTGLDVIHGKARLFGQKNGDKIIGLSNDLRIWEYLPYMRFPQPSSFYRKKFLGGSNLVNEQLDYAMDFELVTRAALAGAKIKRTDELLSHYRLHPGSKSNHETRFLDDWSQVVHRTLSSFEDGKVYAAHLEKLGMVPHPVNKKFDTSISLSEADIASVFLDHLHIQYHTRYRWQQKRECLEISEFLRKHHNSFYHKNNYHKYNFRLKFIPRFVFGIARRWRD